MSLAALAGCNAIVDPTDTQCETDSDCAAEFGKSVCSPEKVCLSTECSSTNECTDRLGQESYCRPSDGTCVPLLTEDCKAVYPRSALEEDDVIVIGFMGKIEGSTYGVPLRRGAEIAFNDFDETTGGLPGVGGQGRRHLAMLVCNHTDDKPESAAIARHLTDVVQVPAIIGPSTSGVTLHVFDEVAQAAGVLLLSASATSPVIADRRAGGMDENLLWRTAPSDVVQTEVMKALLPDISRALAGAGVIEQGEYPRVAVAYKDDPAGRGLFDAIRTTSAFANAAPALKISVFTSYDPNADLNDWDEQLENLEIDANPPHLIIPMGTDESVSALLPAIERNWPSGSPRPWYLLPEGARQPPLHDFVTATDTPPLYGRVLGTAPGARQSPLYGPFRTLARTDDPGSLAEFAYDAAYLLAYAIARTGKQFPTGRELGDRLTEMTCKGGASLRARSNFFSEDINTAASADCVDFDGASGPLDFDEKLHDAVSDIALWCIRSRPAVTIEQNIQTYFAVQDTEDLDTGMLKQGMIRVTKGAQKLDLTQDDWCNLNTEQ